MLAPVFDDCRNRGHVSFVVVLFGQNGIGSHDYSFVEIKEAAARTTCVIRTAATRALCEVLTHVTLSQCQSQTTSQRDDT